VFITKGYETIKGDFLKHEHRPVESRIKKHELSYCGNAILYNGKCFKGTWKGCWRRQAKYLRNASPLADDVVKRVVTSSMLMDTQLQIQRDLLKNTAVGSYSRICVLLVEWSSIEEG
jgi:hypothetical protein